MVVLLGLVMSRRLIGVSSRQRARNSEVCEFGEVLAQDWAATKHAGKEE